LKLTYAGHLPNLRGVDGDPRHVFVEGDVCDGPLVREIFAEYRPRAVVHLAAESHVDRSIDGPAEFLRTNVLGTFVLLEAATEYWRGLGGLERDRFRFLHVSTDEVYGSAEGQTRFREHDRYCPSSVYAASKASADHFVHAYGRTYGLPTLVTHCTNNYGPRQYPEKLIPLVIRKTIVGERLPVYGDGLHERDWLYVQEHCRALVTELDLPLRNDESLYVEMRKS
jgi:dTDP-glucose 4,6-dehydratase